VECRVGYKRVRLCVREDLFRAIVLIEASEGLRRYKIIEDALLMYLEGRNKNALGGFRILTVSEDLFNQLASIGNGSAEAGLRLLLEDYHNHQLVAPNTQAQSQAWTKAEAQAQANAQPQVHQQSGEDELGFLENNPWVNIIKSRGTRSN